MEKITNIEINNFKSIRHAEIKDCRRINVFIGYPNVGKSNILEALGLFNLYNPVLSDDDNARINDLRLNKLNQICRIKNDYELFFNQNTQGKLNITINKLQIQLSTSETGLNGRFGLQSVMKRANSEVKVFRLTPSSLRFEVDEDFNISFKSATDDGEIYIPNRYPDFHVKKYDYLNDGIINKKGKAYLSPPQGENLLDVLQKNPELRSDLASLFKEYNLRFAIENSSQSIKLLKEMIDDTIVIIPYYQIADTLRRLVFFKSAIFSNSNSVLLFEEPEAHMFPPYIRKMTADIVMDKNDNQYFIATHSPYVLDELMAEAADDLSIYLVDYKDGETKIIHLSNEDFNEIREYGVDLFFNIESYLKHGQVNNA